MQQLYLRLSFDLFDLWNEIAVNQYFVDREFCGTLRQRVHMSRHLLAPNLIKGLEIWKHNRQTLHSFKVSF